MYTPHPGDKILLGGSIGTIAVGGTVRCYVSIPDLSDRLIPMAPMKVAFAHEDFVATTGALAPPEL